MECKASGSFQIHLYFIIIEIDYLKAKTKSAIRRFENKYIIKSTRIAFVVMAILQFANSILLFDAEKYLTGLLCLLVSCCAAFMALIYYRDKLTNPFR